MDFYHKKIRALLIRRAHDDPNTFVRELSEAGMSVAEKRDLYYLLQIARRARGYDPAQDRFLDEGIL